VIYRNSRNPADKKNYQESIAKLQQQRNIIIKGESIVTKASSQSKLIAWRQLPASPSSRSKANSPRYGYWALRYDLGEADLTGPAGNINAHPKADEAVLSRPCVPIGV
jgi:hypothetical protein